jgi:hypothetical protein
MNRDDQLRVENRPALYQPFVAEGVGMCRFYWYFWRGAI